MRPLIAFLTVVLAGCGCLNPHACDISAPSGLAERFEAINFFDEEGNEISMARWAGDITVQAIGDAWERDGHREHLGRTLADLSAATGRQLELTDSNGHIRIWLTEWAQFRREAAVSDYSPDADCRAKVTNHTGGIAWAMVHIYPDLSPQHIRWCIAQELAQSLGPTNDIADPLGTVFSSTSRRETLSDSDRRILRILYDRRLWHGMSRQQAMPIVREIIADMGGSTAASR